MWSLFFWLHSLACGILVLRPGIELLIPCGISRGKCKQCESYLLDLQGSPSVITFEESFKYSLYLWGDIYILKLLFHGVSFDPYNSEKTRGGGWCLLADEEGDVHLVELKWCREIMNGVAGGGDQGNRESRDSGFRSPWGSCWQSL